MVIFDTFHNMNMVIIIREQGGNYDLIFHPQLLLMVVIALLILIAGIYRGAVYQNTIFQSYSIKKLRATIAFATTGILLIVTSMLLDPGLTILLGKIITLVGLLIIVGSTGIIINSITQNPLTNIYLPSNSEPFIDNHIVNYALYANKDQGPQIINKSSHFSEQTDITDTKLLSYGLQSVSLAFNEEGYAQNVSIAPFMGKSDLLL